MYANLIAPPRPARRRQAIALHCSGAGAGQWSTLAATLGDGFELATPEHYGCESAGPWTGEHAFTLADEAARVIALIDRCEDTVQLVGHSYGGAVALHVALARAHRIAGMALYEPSAFHLLKHMGEAGAEAYAEIAGVARRALEGVITGDHRGAMAAFVDYWNGHGTWDRMPGEARKALMRWAPKVPLEFRALLDDPTPAEAYRGLACPVLFLAGERAPAPTRLLTEGLSSLLPESRLLMVSGAGHMGPMTHACEVAALIGQHVAEAADMPRAPRWHPPALTCVPASLSGEAAS